MIKLIALMFSYIGVCLRFLSLGGVSTIAFGIEIDKNSVPYTPTSHPFIERLIGPVRREILDKTFDWNICDLQNKLELFKKYYNEERGLYGIGGVIPLKKTDESLNTVVSIDNYRWKKHCQSLFELRLAV